MNKYATMNNKRTNKSPLPNAKFLNKMVYQHYRNSVYNGFKKAGKRCGYGIILFDNGQCVIAQLNKNQQYHGHNVFIQNRRLISVQFQNGIIKQLVCRVDGFLIYLKYDGNKLKKLHGNSYLIDYENNKIFLFNFQHGLLKSKGQDKQKNLHKKVFQQDNTLSIIGQKHNNVINYKFFKSQIITQKVGNKIHVSYVKNNFPYGLGFIFNIRASHGGYNPQTNKNQDSFQLKYVEKGMYNNSSINGFGQRIFKNGNIYVGGFIDNVFDGYGILKNLKKKNWVYGKFEKGQLSQMLDYNNQGNIENCQQYMLELHKKYQKFNNQIIKQIDFSFIDKELENFLNHDILFIQKSLEERKKQTLKKILQQFTDDKPLQINNIKLINNNQDKGNNQIKSFLKINSFISNQKTNVFYIEDQSKRIKHIQTQNKQSSLNKSRKKIFKDLVNSSITPSKIIKQEEGSSLLKLHKIKDQSKKKKHLIFQPRNSKQKQISRSLLKSSSKQRKKKSRSPIFTKKIDSLRQSIFTDPRISSIKQNKSLKHWNSIKQQTLERKSSIKKSPRKSKIFDSPTNSQRKMTRFNYQFVEDNAFQS